MKTVIFACVHNAGRSQMAAAFFNALVDDGKACAVSAGTEPGERVHPEVIAVMKEVGIDLSKAQPQRLTLELAKNASLLVTMGCGDACPVVPGLRRDDWPLPDPKEKPVEEVRRIRDENRDRHVHAAALDPLVVPQVERSLLGDLLLCLTSLKPPPPDVGSDEGKDGASPGCRHAATSPGTVVIFDGLKAVFRNCFGRGDR